MTSVHHIDFHAFMAELMHAAKTWFARMDIDKSNDIDPGELRGEFVRLGLDPIEVRHRSTLHPPCTTSPACFHRSSSCAFMPDSVPTL